MALSNFWRGRTGRLPYLVALVISSAAIAVLPFIAGKIIAAFVAVGADPALAIVRMLLRPLLLGIGLLSCSLPEDACASSASPAYGSWFFRSARSGCCSFSQSRTRL